MLFFFSEKTLRRNSPSSLGSNVDGTIQYVPGGSLNLQLTSLRLMKDGDLATDALYVKKFVSNGFGRLSGFSNWNFKTQTGKSVNKVILISMQWKNLNGLTFLGMVPNYEVSNLHLLNIVYVSAP